MQIMTYLILSIVFSIDIVIGNLEQLYVQQQNNDHACDGSNTSTNLGTAGNVLACSRLCSSKSECLGFYFNETDGSCWGSNQTECQVAANAVFYRKDCVIPPAIPNAQVSAGGAIDGDMRTYSCLPGYVLGNVVTLNTTCKRDGTWTTAQFDCLRDCEAPSTIPNTQVLEGGTLQGDTRKYTCSSGYVIRNVVTVNTTCHADGTWSTPSFDCLWDCGISPTMAFGTVSAGFDSLQGSTRSYTCDYGYGTTGTATITCMDITGWSAPTSMCTELVCDSGWQKIELSCYFTPGSGPGFESDVFTARDLCHTYNGYLVELETQNESDAVKTWIFSAYPGIDVWIGLSDEAVEGTWVWMNTSVPTTWTDWLFDQPNGGTMQNNTVLMADGTWQDKSWEFSRPPLCEKSPVPS